MKAKVTKAQQNGTPSKAKVKSEKSQSDISKSLRNFMVAQLKSIYWAEKALTKSLPKMIEKAKTDELIEALMGHLKVTQKHSLRLEEVFLLMNEKAEEKTCRTMEGLIKEAEEIIESTQEGIVRDAGIITNRQKIEHYEIATYSSLCLIAKTLGENDAVVLLQESLEEAKDADEMLSTIIQSIVHAEVLVMENVLENSKAPKPKSKLE